MASLSHVSFTKVYLVHNGPNSIIKTLHHPKNVVFKGKYGKEYNNYLREIVSIYSEFANLIREKLGIQDEEEIYRSLEEYEKQTGNSVMEQVKWIIDESKIKLSYDSFEVKFITKRHDFIIFRKYYNDNTVELDIIPLYSDIEIDHVFMKMLYVIFKGINGEKLTVNISKPYHTLIPILEILHESETYLDQDDYLRIREYNDGTLRFGIEFEINNPCYINDYIYKDIDGEFYMFVYSLRKIIRRHNLLFQRDCSVTFGEIKTCPLEYDKAIEVAKDLDNLRYCFRKYFSRRNSIKAGYHIHFSKLSSTMDNRVAAIGNKLFDQLDLQIIEKFFGRSFNRYCEKNVPINSRDRFLNHTNAVTIELRIPTTSLRCKSITDVLEFTKLLAELGLDESVSIDDAVTQLEQFITSKVEMYEKVCMSK